MGKRLGQNIGIKNWRIKRVKKVRINKYFVKSGVKNHLKFVGEKKVTSGIFLKYVDESEAK